MKSKLEIFHDNPTNWNPPPLGGLTVLGYAYLVELKSLYA